MGMAKNPTLEQQLTEARNKLAESQQANETLQSENENLKRQTTSPAPAPAAPAPTAAAVTPAPAAPAPAPAAEVTVESLQAELTTEREAGVILAKTVTKLTQENETLKKTQMTGEARAAQILASAGHPQPLPANPSLESTSPRLKVPVAPLPPGQQESTSAKSARNRAALQAWCQESVDLHSGEARN